CATAGASSNAAKVSPSRGKHIVKPSKRQVHLKEDSPGRKRVVHAREAGVGTIGIQQVLAAQAERHLLVGVAQDAEPDGGQVGLEQHVARQRVGAAVEQDVVAA